MSPYWKKQIRFWHWVSGAFCLAGVLLFSVTGVTLNHAGRIPATPRIEETVAQMPELVLEALSEQPHEGETMGLPASVASWLSSEMGVSTRGRRAEWTDLDVYVGLPRPGGDGWLSIDRETGEVVHEVTTRGVVAYLNDLHKGRETGLVWVLFMDVFAVACVLFSVTGLLLLQIHAAKRPSTWPLTLAGIALPLLIIAVFVH